MLLITGCHRSGTSLIAGIVNSLAEHTGLCNPIAKTPQLPAAYDNQTGFYESKSLTQANDTILKRFGCSWDSPWIEPPNFSRSEMRSFLRNLRNGLEKHLKNRFWVDKDPRLCLTLDALDYIFLHKVPIVATLRHPFAVAESLRMRNGFSLKKGLYIWTLYNFHLSRTASSQLLAWINFPENTCNSYLLAERLRVPIEKTFVTTAVKPDISLRVEEMAQIIERHFRPDLVHNNSQDFVRSIGASQLAEACESAWQRAHDLINKNNNSPDISKVNSIFLEPLAFFLRECGSISDYSSTSLRLWTCNSSGLEHSKNAAKCKDQIGELEKQNKQLTDTISSMTEELKSLRQRNSELFSQMQEVLEQHEKQLLLTQKNSSDLQRITDKLLWHREQRKYLLSLIKAKPSLMLHLTRSISRMALASAPKSSSRHEQLQN